jgi:hypothetical protein
MALKDLNDWEHFHDWYLAGFSIGPNVEPRIVSLDLYLGEARATVTFEGVTCLCLANLGLLNIVYSIRLIEPSEKNYQHVLTELKKGERISDRMGSQLAFMYATLGAELAIEFDSMKIEATAS